MATTRARKPKKVKARSDVSSNGLALFILGLLIALFFGGAFRALTSERQVSRWIDKALASENPKFTFQFASARVRLADGIVPQFGLEFTDLELAPKDRCLVPARLSLNRLFLPISLSQLYHEKLRFNFIAADQVKLELLSPNCTSAEAARAAEIVPEEVAKKSDKKAKSGHPVARGEAEPQFATPIWLNDYKQFIANRWALELRNTQKWLDGLRINRFMILTTREGLSEIDLENVQLNTNDGVEMSLAFDFLPRTVWSSRIFGRPTQVSIVVTPKTAALSWNGHLREGLGELRAEVILPSAEVKAHFTTSHLPAPQLLEALASMRVVTDDLQLKRMWVGCEFSYDAPIESWWKSPILAEKCSLEGEGGKVEVERLELFPWRTGSKYTPFTVQFANLSLQRLLEMLNRQGYSGVISQFGDLSGRLQVSESSTMKFLGELKGLELGFSRRSVRAAQRIDRLTLEVSLKDAQISGLVSDLQLKDGRMAGYLSFALDQKFLQGDFQVKIDELEFNPEVQELLLSGSLSPLAIFGSGKIADGHVSSWSGDLGALKAQGVGWSAQLIKVKSNYERGVMSLQTRMTGLELNLAAEPAIRLRPALAAGGLKEDDLRLRNIHLRLELQRGGGTWKAGQAQLASGALSLTSSGEWARGEVAGLLTAESQEQGNKKWTILGPWADLKVFEATR